MKLEDYPVLQTQPIGVEPDGTVVKLYPLSSTQLATVTSAVTLAMLPTTNPHVAGQIWNNAGVPTVSAG